MNRLAVMAHYEPRGQLAPHVEVQVESLARAVDRLIVVSTAALTDEARRWLADRAELVERPNYGYDFFSYRTGLEAAGDLERYDEVVVCNDTFVPLKRWESVFDAMADRRVDFWGLTRSDRFGTHLQSFFVVFRPWVVSSHAFRSFWATMTPLSTRWDVIRRYEIGLSQHLVQAGFRFGAYFEPTEQDARMAQRRMNWWTAWRLGASRDLAGMRWWHEQRLRPWNPSVALADRACHDARLPFVKLDTLRQDPYNLNAGRLLDLCERVHPHAFHGLREFLAETAGFYPARPKEQLRRVPPALRPLRRLVEYGHDQ